MWKRKILLQLDVKKWKGKRNVHSGGNGECLDHLKSEYQSSGSITGASAHLAGSEAALKESQDQTDTPAPAALLASSHHAPGTSVSIHLPEEQSWDKAMGEAQLDAETKLNKSLPLSSRWETLQHHGFMTNAVAIAEDNVKYWLLLQPRVASGILPFLPV